MKNLIKGRGRNNFLKLAFKFRFDLFDLKTQNPGNSRTILRILYLKIGQKWPEYEMLKRGSSFGLVPKIFLCLFFSFSMGCITFPARNHISDDIHKSKMLSLLPITFIETRIQALTMILSHGDLTITDRKMARKLLNSCHSMKEAILNYISEDQYQIALNSFLHDLNLIDEYYFIKKKDFFQGDMETFSIFVEKKKALMDLYLSGNYRGVINKCLELEKLLGANALTTEISMLFSLSLAQEELFEEAIETGQGIIRAFESKPDLIHFKIKLAEWRLTIGQSKKALQDYGKLTDNIDELNGELLLLKNRISLRNSFSESIIEKGPYIQKNLNNDILSKELNKILQMVAQLVEEERLDEARDLLISQKDILSTDLEKETVDQALNNLELLEEKQLRSKLKQISDNTKGLESSREFLDQEQFEKALEKLASLKMRQQDYYEIMSLKKRATEGIIQKERNRAAKLFLAAKKTYDLKKKEALFLSSRKILEALIIRFPFSSLANKIKDNKEKVTHELNKLGFLEKQP